MFNNYYNTSKNQHKAFYHKHKKQKSLEKEPENQPKNEQHPNILLTMAIRHEDLCRSSGRLRLEPNHDRYVKN